jgi:ADP-ribose pyrophosphatase
MERQKPLQSSLVYRSPIFAVYEEEVKLPKGNIAKVSRIDHRRTVSVVPVRNNGSVVMIRQYRPAIGRHLLEIPAGRVNNDEESCEECAQREMAEEIGHRAEKLVKLFEGYLVPGYGNEYMYYYLAVGLYPQPLPPDDDEDIETMEMPMEALLRMVRKAEITDSKTALGILLAADYLRQQRMSPYHEGQDRP